MLMNRLQRSAGFFVCKLKKLSNTKRETDAKEDAEVDAEEQAAAAIADGMFQRSSLEHQCIVQMVFMA